MKSIGRLAAMFTMVRGALAFCVAWAFTLPKDVVSVVSSDDLGDRQFGTNKIPVTSWLKSLVLSSRPLQVVAAAAVVGALGCTWGAAGAQAAGANAYEQVSPTAKGGRNVTQTLGVASSNGDNVLYGAYGAFAESPAQPLPAFYGARRDSQAWTSRSASLPMNPLIGITGPFVNRIWGVSASFDKVVITTNAALTPDGWDGTTVGANPGGPPLPMYLHNIDSGEVRLITPLPASGIPYTSVFIGGTPDLSEIVFETMAELTDDAESLADTQWKIYRWRDGVLTLESRELDGTPASGVAGPAAPGTGKLAENAVSENGQVIYYNTPSSGTPQRLLRKEGDDIAWVNDSENPSTAGQQAAAIFRGATPDGSKVLFTTNLSLVPEDTNTVSDLYLYTHSADPESDDNLTLLSPDNDPSAPAGANVLGVLGMNDAGSRVYFVTGNQITAGQPASTSSANRHIYVWGAGEDEPQYLGTTSSNASDLGSGAAPWGQPNSATQVPTNKSRIGRGVAKNGMTLVMLSATNLDNARDTGGELQAHVYTEGSGRFQCVSCPADGSPATHAASLGGGSGFTGLFESADRRNVSNGGGQVVFQTQTVLDESADSNSRVDVYKWSDGESSLVSTGRSTFDSFFIGADAGGRNIFFTTTEALSATDTDEMLDVYVSREGGGLAVPPGAPPPCGGDECQGPPSEPPALLNLGSASLASDGNDPSVADLVRSSVTVSKLKALTVSAARFTVRVPDAGRIVVRGPWIRRVDRSAKKAGAYRLRIALKPRAKRVLRRRNRLRVLARVVFRGRDGQSDSKTVKVTFKQPKRNRAKGGR